MIGRISNIEHPLSIVAKTRLNSTFITVTSIPPSENKMILLVSVSSSNVLTDTNDGFGFQELLDSLKTEFPPYTR